ncbi:unnamed protein product [Caenorhabditis bovis]|uniref:Uncharacterized protein n=1 Tax=Caenorhabditis bovis TaxID=2654633 RepID=A0A8S1F929_9PELO|nr:unnamed protein product [Caenorhabditis bovis]
MFLKKNKKKFGGFNHIWVTVFGTLKNSRDFIVKLPAFDDFSTDTVALYYIRFAKFAILLLAKITVVYRENNDDLSNSSKPVRFWELVEYIPTTPPPPPPPPPPPTTTTTTTTTTTENPCESSKPVDLTRRLRDTSGYDKIYMANDFVSASASFSDLRNFVLKPPAEYHCGKRCQRSSQMIRSIMKGHAPSEAVRAWWDEEEWDRRKKRKSGWDDTSRLLMKNTGTSRHVLGMTVAVECDDEDGPYSNGGYSLCTTCRAVRHLPSNFFPRVINEIICSQKSCLHSEGKCVQRVMPMKILRNVGTKECARWVLSTVEIRTCCDCVLSPSSPLVSYL